MKILRARNICKKCFSGKVGVFTEKYQPFFPDSIGSCASKEGPVVINSINFEKSSIEVFDCVEIDSEEDQYYYEVDYKCKRKKYTDDGDPKKLRENIPNKLLLVAEAFRKKINIKRIHNLSKIDPWFLEQIKEIIDNENKLKNKGVPRDFIEFNRIKCENLLDFILESKNVAG